MADGARAISSSPVSTTASRRPAGFRPALWLCIALLLTHLGLVLLVALASGWPRRLHERAPEIDRNPVEPFARLFVYFFALTPAACAIAIVFASGRLGPLDRVAPLVVLSGLAVVVAAGDQVLLYRERMVSSTWLGLLVAPPVLIVLGIAAAAVDLRHRSQDRAAGQCRGPLLRRQFPAPHRQAARLRHRRCASSRRWSRSAQPEPAACLFRLGAAAQSMGQRPPISSEQGGILVWPAADNTGTPPATLKAQFPDHGAGSAALVRALDAGPAAADPARLGGGAPARQPTRRVTPAQ